jgi:hypothetical protein
MDVDVYIICNINKPEIVLQVHNVTSINYNIANPLYNYVLDL